MRSKLKITSDEYSALSDSISQMEDLIERGCSEESADYYYGVIRNLEAMRKRAVIQPERGTKAAKSSATN